MKNVAFLHIDQAIFGNYEKISMLMSVHRATLQWRICHCRVAIASRGRPSYRYKPDAQVLQVLCVRVDDVHELGIRGVQVDLRLGALEEQLARVQTYRRMCVHEDGEVPCGEVPHVNANITCQQCLHICKHIAPEPVS